MAEVGVGAAVVHLRQYDSDAPTATPAALVVLVAGAAKLDKELDGKAAVPHEVEVAAEILEHVVAPVGAVGTVKAQLAAVPAWRVVGAEKKVAKFDSVTPFYQAAGVAFAKLVIAVTAVKASGPAHWLHGIHATAVA